MRKYLVLIVLLSGVIFTACDDGSVLESNDIESNKAEEGEIVVLDNTNEFEGILWEADSEIGVVLAHGAVYDAASWEAQGKQFAEENIIAFAVKNTDKDELIAVANMLKNEMGVEKVALVGASAGGASSIEAVKEDETVFDKLILLSPVGDPTRIKDIPVFVIYSEKEGFKDLEESEASNIKTLEIPGDAHAQALFKDDEKSEKIMKEMIDFLKE